MKQTPLQKKITELGYVQGGTIADHMQDLAYWVLEQAVIYTDDRLDAGDSWHKEIRHKILMADIIENK